MSDRRYKSGPAREQGFLLPPCVDDYVSEGNPVRAIDVYVDTLDLEDLGFTNSHGGLTKGQPAYSPSDLLKLYLYGYLNRVQSSRRLEQETYRNLEVIWLLRDIHPSYKTIADFRKNNLSGIQSANKDFVLLCKDLELFGGELVGIDGAFFKGDASKGSIRSKNQLKKRLEKIEVNIARYLQELEDNDGEVFGESIEDDHLQEKLARLKARRNRFQNELKDLEKSGQNQVSSTDPDARLLSKRGDTTAGYNAQYAVDDKHKLLVVCDVNNDGNDLRQLFPMAKKAKDELEVERLEVAADSGYYNQAHLKDCHEEGITPYVAIPKKKGSAHNSGRFARQDFQYDKDRDAYQCPAGNYLEKRSRQCKGDVVNYKYVIKSSVCKNCDIKDKCLPEKTPYRQIYRYEHEELMEAHQARMREKGRAYMKKRASLAEHPFGTLKLWLGWTHFLMRGLAKVNAEMNLLMLSYNFKRVLNIIGIEAFREYCLQRRSGIQAGKPEKSSAIYLFYQLILFCCFLFNLLKNYEFPNSDCAIWNLSNQRSRIWPNLSKI